MDENRQERLEKMLSRYCETRDVGLRNELVTEYMYLADAAMRDVASITRIFGRLPPWRSSARWNVFPAARV